MTTYNNGSIAAAAADETPLPPHQPPAAQQHGVAHLFVKANETFKPDGAIKAEVGVFALRACQQRPTFAPDSCRLKLC